MLKNMSKQMLKQRYLVLCLLAFLCGTFVPSKAQVPCSAVTRNPQMLEMLVDEQRAIEAREQMEAESVVEAVELSQLKFAPITIQPGDALYAEYKGKNFTIHADYLGGDTTAFDVPSQASEEHWRKGILLLDHVMGLNQQLVHLSVIALGENQPQFRNVRFIRAGSPVFKFTKLDANDAPRVVIATQRLLEMPCLPNGNLNPSPQMMNTGMTATPYVPAMPPAPGAPGPYVPTLGMPSTVASAATLPMAVATFQSNGTVASNHYKYTGKERDDESGLDNYGARMYSSNMGRFISPDWAAKPAAVPYANLYDPQSLNLYSYVRNNPISKVDVDGHCPICFLELAGEGLAYIAVETGAADAVIAAGVELIETVRGAMVLHSLLKNHLPSQSANSDSRPGTHGKPDHKKTVEEEGDRVSGDTEVPIKTSGGKKESRRADAVGTNQETGQPEVVQVYRPTPAGNVPKREQDAAADIQNATGVKPTMVPVRPLPSQPSPPPMPTAPVPKELKPDGPG